MASQDWFEKDFYAILGVPQDADDAAIKKAYRKLARKHHPDQNPGDAAAEQRFKDIGEANSVLSDPEQRQEYDAVRQMARGGARFTAGGPGGGNGGFEDVFSSMFGGGGTGGARGALLHRRRRRPARPRGPARRHVRWRGRWRPGLRRAPGSGAPQGPRKGADLHGPHDAVVPRRGRGRDRHPRHQPAAGRSPRGSRPGSRTARRSGCAARASRGEPGAPRRRPHPHRRRSSKHPVFGRDGDNLTVDLPVTFAEAALGATVSVPTLDGSTPVKVRIAPGTPSGRVLRVKGRGRAAQGRPGDLLAKVSVVVPQRLSDEAREAARGAAGAGRGPRPARRALRRTPRR